MTKEQTYENIMRLKTQLEIKVNCKYLPLQRQRDVLFERTDFKRIMEIETIMLPLKNEIANEYDELLRLRNEYMKKFYSNA